jgi:hypothetical protein
LSRYYQYVRNKVTRVGHAENMGEMRNTYKIFVGNPEGKIPL